MIEKYASLGESAAISADSIFNVDSSEVEEADAIEQIINASAGNMRRLKSLLDLSMNAAYEEHQGGGKVSANNVGVALRRHSSSTEALYTRQERDFLLAIAQTCKSRRTFRFQFPNKTPALYKFTSKSDEHNVLNVIEAGMGRRRTTYAFDYSYCIDHDIPTHYVKGTERIDESRSRKLGDWIMRVAQISDELLEHASLFTKIEGVISYVNPDSTVCLLDGDDQVKYYLHTSNIIFSDQLRPLIVGRRVKFYPVLHDSDNTAEASAAELL